MLKQSEPEVFCNLCGLSCALVKEDESPCGMQLGGLIKAKCSGGYFSTAGNGYGALDDCSEYTFSLCEFCLDWLFSQFRNPVKEVDYVAGIEENWKPALEKVNKDDWRKWKKQFKTEFERRNKAREQGQKLK